MSENLHKDWTGNGNSIWKTLGASNHTEKEREADDYYATDGIAIDKLIKVEHPNVNIWECAAGGGHLSERLKKFGGNVFSSDIKNRGYTLDKQMDFLLATKDDIPFSERFDIITNPPYKLAKEFVLKGLDLLPDEYCRLYMFLKLTFLEGKARYNEIFSQTPPCKVYVFSERIMCAKNGEFERMKAGGGSATAFAWFVWQKGYTGDTIVKWI